MKIFDRVYIVVDASGIIRAKVACNVYHDCFKWSEVKAKGWRVLLP